MNRNHPVYMEDTLKFINDVIAEYNERMKSHPYQINLLEEVHMHDDGQRKDLSGAKKIVCENAHTRILEKFLRFQTQKGYEFFMSLIEYVKEKPNMDNWSNIRIETPLFKPEYNCEKTSGRIDLLVWEEKKYAIIFENKINDAGDQEHQLARYISHLCQSGFSEKQIFVLYLSSEGIEKDFEQTWCLEDGTNYKESFQPRFLDFSYRYELLPWLTDKIAASMVSLSYEPYLKSAIEQYIDYLKGKFGLRRNEAPIIREILEKKVVGDSLNSKLRWLEQKREETTELIKKLKKSTDITDYSKKLRQTKLIQEGLYSIKTEMIQNEVGDTPFPIYERSKVYERTCHFGYIITNHTRQYLLYIYQYGDKFGTSVISYPNKNERIDADSERLFMRLDRYGKNHSYKVSYFDLGDYQSAIRKLKEVLDDVRHT